VTAATRNSTRDALLFAFLALYFYRLGVTSLEGFFNYPFWRDMGPMMSNADFIQLRADHIWKIYILLVVPAGILVLVTAALTVVGAPPVPRWAFVGALVFQLIAVASTVTIQLPIQQQLDVTGYSAAAIERLISTDLLLRKLPSLLEGGLVIVALWKVIVAGRQAGRALS
jgi:hypothetical protein